MTLNPIKKDKRYTIQKELCGEPGPRYVLRFSGEFIAQSKYYDTVLIRAVGHHAERRGALIIEAIEE